MKGQAASLLMLLLLIVPAFLCFSRTVSATPFRPKVVQAEGDVRWGAAKRNCPASGGLATPSAPRVLLVKSIFTTAPYSTPYSGVDSFYSFYTKYQETPRGRSVSSDLGWLRTPLSAALSYNGGWGVAYPIYLFMASGCVANFSVLNDTQVDSGQLFSSNGSRRFDVAVMGKSEYVTSRELDQYAQFVRSGGRLVLIDSDSFEVEVSLDSCPGPCERFVNGHGWTYSEGMVRSGAWNAFPDLDRKLTAGLLPPDYYLTGQIIGAGSVNPGSVMGSALYRSFGPTVLSDYTAFEESRLVNESGTTKLISFDYGIHSYVHRFGLGDVVCLCLEGSKIISTHPVIQEFLSLAISTWGPRATGEVDSSLLAVGEPKVDRAGAWMQWRSNHDGVSSVYMVATALNSKGQAVAFGQSTPQAVAENQTACFGLVWDHALSSVDGIAFRLFVVTSDEVPVSIVIRAEPPGHPMG